MMTMGRIHFGWALMLICAMPWALQAQEPATARDGAQKDSNQLISSAAIAGSKQDPAAVARGATVFRTYCAGCHGVAANGGAGAPDLVRSLLVLDDEKGILIAPVVREGRPDKGMPRLGLTEPQIADVVAWLHARTYAAGHRATYAFQEIRSGDPKQGAAYFRGAGGCSGCHSATGDLAGIGKKYDSLALQTRWLHPRSARRGGTVSPGTERTVTVTLPDGQTCSGKLLHIDDFNVSLRDGQNQFHSFSRDTPGIKVSVHDPLEAHEKLLPTYTDSDIHNVTAYLATLK
jgi:cytochrome c oxidase cbb3-type subunit III